MKVLRLPEGTFRIPLKAKRVTLVCFCSQEFNCVAELNTHARRAEYRPHEKHGLMRCLEQRAILYPAKDYPL